MLQLYPVPALHTSVRRRLVKANVPTRVLALGSFAGLAIGTCLFLGPNFASSVFSTAFLISSGIAHRSAGSARMADMTDDKADQL